MRKKRITTLFILLIAIMLMTSACSNAGQADIYIPEMSETTESESFNATTSVAIDDIPAYKEEISEDTTIEAEITTESIPESSEVISEDSEENNNSPDVSGSEIKPSLPYAEEVRYLDTVAVSCEIITPSVTWIDQGLTLTSADSSSTLFGAGTGLSEREVALNAYEAVGKSVGDTFTLWFRKEDGLHGYEYTIEEILNKDPDTVSYGDKVHTTYTCRGYGVDIEYPYSEYIGETDLIISPKEGAFFCDPGGCIDWNSYQEGIYNMLGLKVGDSFVRELDSPEQSYIYRYTIQSIKKAVAYGDAIKVSSRYAYIPTDKIKGHKTAAKISLDLETLCDDGKLALTDIALSRENIRKLFEQLLGRKRGERFLCAEELDGMPLLYAFSVVDIASGLEKREALDEQHVAFSASQEQVIYMHDSLWLELDDDSLVYAFINDTLNKRIYELPYYYDGFCNLGYYMYDVKYDEHGRIIWYYVDFDHITYEYTYSYNPDGTWTKKETNSMDDSYTIEFHESNGSISIVKCKYSWNENMVVSEYEYGRLKKVIYYDTDGNVTKTVEYDEWGQAPDFWETLYQ